MKVMTLIRINQVDLMMSTIEMFHCMYMYMHHSLIVWVSKLRIVERILQTIIIIDTHNLIKTVIFIKKYDLHYNSILQPQDIHEQDHPKSPREILSAQ